MNLSGTVANPTYGREETRDALQSIADQTRPPEEVLVVDEDLNSPVTKVMTELSFPEETTVEHIQRECGGLTRAKNFAAERANGDIVVYFDDDAVLENDAIENLLDVYKTYNPDGVWMITDERHNSLSLLFSKLFRHGPFQYGLRRRENNPERTGDFYPLDAMGGCGMSVRDYVLEEYKFDPRDTVAFLPEDIDFAYRVAQEYEIGATAKARKHHKQLKRTNLSGEQLKTASYRKVFAYNYLYLVTLDGKPRYLPHYLLVNLGLIVGSLYLSIQHRDLAPLRGTLDGFRQLLRGTTVYEEYLQPVQ
jgi:GT2 family glycosyltransferase